MGMGLRDVSTNVQNPFGMDSTDYPLKDWLVQTFDNVDSILKYDYDESKQMCDEALQAETEHIIRLTSISQEEVNDFLSAKKTLTWMHIIAGKKVGSGMRRRFRGM